MAVPEGHLFLAQPAVVPTSRRRRKLVGRAVPHSDDIVSAAWLGVTAPRTVSPSIDLCYVKECFCSRHKLYIDNVRDVVLIVGLVTRRQ